MTLNYGIFDVSDPQNPDRVYSAALLSRILSKHIRDGIVHGDGNEMAVTVTDPPAMTVRVGTGTAMVQGRFCENDAALTLAVPAAHATYPRIDRVVVRLNASPGRTIDIVVKPGTAAPEPAAPALTRTAEIWELSLAQVRVEAGATSILSAKITDERWDASLCGVACPAYVPSSQLEVVGAVNMQGKALTGLPAPSAGTDAAPKSYVDATLPKLSQIAIDADKDWGGKSITNVNVLTCNRIAPQVVYAPGVGEGAETLFTGTVTKSYGQRPGSGSTATKTVNRVYGTGTISIVLSAPSFESSYYQSITYEVYKNGVQIYTITKNSGSSYSVPALSETIQVPVTSGDMIYAKMTWSDSISSAGTFTMTASAVLSLPLIEGLIT